MFHILSVIHYIEFYVKVKYLFKIEINKNIKIKLTNNEYLSKSEIFKLPAFGLLYIVKILSAAKYSDGNISNLRLAVLLLYSSYGLSDQSNYILIHVSIS